MKLLIYCNRFDDGNSRLVSLCEALAERDYEIHVLSPKGKTTPFAKVHPGTLTDAVPLCGQILPELCLDWEFTYPADLHFLSKPTLKHIETKEMSQASLLKRILYKFSLLGGDSQHRIAREYTLLRNPAAVFFALDQTVGESAISDGADSEWVKVCPLEDPLGDDYNAYVEWLDELLELVRARKVEMEELEIPV